MVRWILFRAGMLRAWWPERTCRTPQEGRGCGMSICARHGWYENAGDAPRDCPSCQGDECPTCASNAAELTRLRSEVSDATCLAYNLDPDRTEPSEMGLCEQINHLGEHITRLRSLAERA